MLSLNKKSASHFWSRLKLNIETRYPGEHCPDIPSRCQSENVGPSESSLGNENDSVSTEMSLPLVPSREIG